MSFVLYLRSVPYINNGFAILSLVRASSGAGLFRLSTRYCWGGGRKHKRNQLLH